MRGEIMEQVYSKVEVILNGREKGMWERVEVSRTAGKYECSKCGKSEDILTTRLLTPNTEVEGYVDHSMHWCPCGNVWKSGE
jgi:hypothetical protein